MKELETHLKLGNKTELNVNKQQEIEHLLIGSIEPRIGHFVWELNEETGEVKKAQYKKDTVSFLKIGDYDVPPKKLIINPDCIYIPALNAENAKKKYLKNKEQSHYYTKEPFINIKDLGL